MKKSTSHYKLLPFIALIVLILISLACASSTSSPTDEPKVSTATSEVAEAGPALTSEASSDQVLPTDAEEPVPTNTPEPTKTPVPELYLGDTVENYGYALTGVSIQDPAIPGMLYTPEEGTKLVAIEVIISNLSGDMLSVNPLNATLVDSEGFTYQTELGGVDEQISTLDLNIGEKVRGLIAFQVPESTISASIKYSVETFGSNILQASLTPPPDGHEPITESQSEVSTQSLPKLGDVVEQYDYSLTAVTVEDPASPGILFEPKQGYKLVAIEIIIGNVSGDVLSVNPLNSYLIDNNGFVYSTELGGRDGQIDTVDLNPGEKVKGWVAFTIPEDASPAAIKYQVEMMSNKYLISGLGK
jgi:hypothetical protein